MLHSVACAGVSEFVCSSVRVRLFHELGSPSLETAPTLPFIVEGGIGVIHVLVTWRRANRGGMFEPCSLLLWWHGLWSGPALEVLEQRAGHIRSRATWELQ